MYGRLEQNLPITNSTVKLAANQILPELREISGVVLIEVTLRSLILNEISSQNSSIWLQSTFTYLPASLLIGIDWRKNSESQGLPHETQSQLSVKLWYKWGQSALEQ